MSVNRKAVVIYGSTDLCIYWDKADKLRPQFTCEAGGRLDAIEALLKIISKYFT